jgi:hypothetical protein
MAFDEISNGCFPPTVSIINGMFEQKRVEATGSWRKPHNEELCNLYSSPNTIRIVKSRRHKICNSYEKKRNSYSNFVGKPKGKRPLRRPRRRWGSNIKMELREIVLGVVDCIDLAQDRCQ